MNTKTVTIEWGSNRQAVVNLHDKVLEVVGGDKRPRPIVHEITPDRYSSRTYSAIEDRTIRLGIRVMCFVVCFDGETDPEGNTPLEVRVAYMDKDGALHDSGIQAQTKWYDKGWFLLVEDRATALWKSLHGVA